MRFTATKHYDHSVGLSVAFRQWRANSHCRFLHGYALSVTLEFSSETLDAHHWVMDFGNLKDVREWLKDTFDHKTLIAKDDPQLDWFRTTADKGLIQLVVVDATSCEAFAALILHHIQNWLTENGHAPRVAIKRVTVCEHSANCASVEA